MSLAPTALAATLALHPFAAPTAAMSHHAEPTDPDWRDVEAATTPAPAPAPSATVAPTPPPQPIKPAYEFTKGTGLMIGAGVTSGLAWAAAFARMGLVDGCRRAVLADADPDGVIGTDLRTRSKCLFRAGAANAGLAISQAPLDLASWLLAAGAGFVRGRHDGTEDGWGGRWSNRSVAAIGGGFTLMVVSAATQAVTMATAKRPFEKLAAGDTRGFETDLRLRYFGVQASAAAASAGLGLLAYGFTYLRAHRDAPSPVYLIRVAPSYHVDRPTRSSYAGVAVSGRF